MTPLCTLLGSLLLAPASAPQAPREDYTDAQVLKVWEALEDNAQEEISEWFQAEVVWIDSFQNSLLRFVLDAQARDAGTWPVEQEAPFYDPAIHAPAQPIARHALGVNSAQLSKKREQFFFRVPERKLDSAWRYDYATGELRRLARLGDPDRIFRNGLRGFPPGLDLAEALLEQQLDDGSQSACALAFGHAYTDRKGSVFTGLTLYDAWSSGANMEMPDVDTLGVVHDLTGNWKTFKAPVSGHKQGKLYDRVGELFQPLHRHRGLRHALALCFFSGYPVLRDGYGANLDRFHSLWDQQESTPAKLIKKLPRPKTWEKFLKSWIKKVDRSKSLQKAGLTRRDTLYNDGLRVRRKLIAIMVEAGYLGD